MAEQEPHRTGRSALPAPRNRLIGRDDHVAEIVSALAGARLVTLTGPAGAGKTRLALAALAATGDPARTGLVWVELAGLHDPAQVAAGIARALGASPGFEEDPIDAVAERLCDAEVLLGLDNCEHLVEDCAKAVDALLDACPGVRVLATSREPLGVWGENTWPVPPLAVPPGGAHVLPPVVSGSPAGELFEQCARALNPGFRIAEDNAAAVARLCRRLDGLPLAIELAAARTRVLSVEQIADGLDDALRLLVGGARTAPPRHRTLRATLDWSHDLLTEREAVVFRRLAVFPGSFDLAAAERVATGESIDRADVLDLLGRLAERSLLQVNRAASSTRYRMLSTVRDYGRDRLTAAGEGSTVGAAHLQYYCELAERAEPLLAGPTQTAELDRLEGEANNLRAALAFARDHGHYGPGIRLAAALWRLCCLRGHYREGLEWLDWAASADPAAPLPLRAKALQGGGNLAFLQCEYPAAVLRLETALQLYRESDDGDGTASVLQLLGCIARERGEYDRSEALHRESLALFASRADHLGVARARGYLGFLAWLQQRWAVAEAHCAAALAQFRELGDGEGITWSLISLGTIAQYQGSSDRARQLLEEAGGLARRGNYPEGIAWSAHERGLLGLRTGEQDAEDRLTDALERHRKLGDRWRTASVLQDLAAAALQRGDAVRSATLLGAASALRDQIGAPLPPCEQADDEATRLRALTLLGPDGFGAAWERGRLGNVDDALTGEPTASPAVIPSARTPSAGAQAVAAVTALRIRVLGASTVQRGDQVLTAADWGYGKPRELLFLLASSGRIAKEDIGTALWPDLGEARLRNAFHTALRELRRALGDPRWVTFEQGGYLLDRSRGLASDLDTFTEALAAARSAPSSDEKLQQLERAIAAYGGDFLPDFLDADWARVRREQFRTAYGAALSAAGRQLVAARRFAEAAAVFRRAAAQDPLDEAAHRVLMAALLQVGEPGRAAQVYTSLASRLHDELGIAPAAETTAIYRRLLARAPEAGQVSGSRVE
jgi:predicted ATPase/DNA-binding SARP family transcriptional activator